MAVPCGERQLQRSSGLRQRARDSRRFFAQLGTSANLTRMCVKFPECWALRAGLWSWEARDARVSGARLGSSIEMKAVTGRALLDVDGHRFRRPAGAQ